MHRIIDGIGATVRIASLLTAVIVGLLLTVAMLAA